MLRIEKRSETASAVTYALAGQVTREHLPEIGRLLSEARGHGRRVTLDLGAVMLVDREVIRFLAAGPGTGAELVDCPAYVLSWIRCEGGELERKKSS